MSLTILDTADTYHKLLSAKDINSRQEIFQRELIQPFEGLVRIMGGGGDAAQMFRMWGMFPEQFEGEVAKQMSENLQKLEEADAWGKTTQALKDGLQAFKSFSLPEYPITFGLMLADLSKYPSRSQYSGFGAIPGWIMTVYGVPDDYNLYRIKACTVHELHHNILRRLFPVNMMTWTLGEYMIMEGLAESFAQELYGVDTIGYWVTDFDMACLQEVKEKFASVLELTGFNTIRGYIFGDDFAGGQSGIERVGVPAFSGYALGYHVVQAYLQKTGKRVTEATFTPAATIIQESGFF